MALMELSWQTRVMPSSAHARSTLYESVTFLVM